ncbi:unnamed protein product [Paramecium sonneborni]|uniref:Transmembrane protein n=1 Tax=Paramecium sonneborni TaxID=65129 RepID=A0A8S1R6Y7_9CILI|nr:unnamed protein product [Paramecium sonneborni]
MDFNVFALDSQTSQQLCYKTVRDMKKKNLISTLWQIVNKMSRKKEKKDKWIKKKESEFSKNINRGALSCFAELCTELACNNQIKEVNLSRCNINIYYAIELANLVQKNTNIQVLDLAGCNLKTFSLSCIFKSMIDHTGLTRLNLSNNQGFTFSSAQDFCQYVLKGKNPLIEINLSFCNLNNIQLSLILPNLKYLKSLKRFIISIVKFTSSESILALRSAMLNYTGNKSLDYLDLSWNRIKNEGLELLSQALFISVRQINIRSLNLEYNQLTQDCLEFLEAILLKLNIEEINLSKNRFSEFQNQTLLEKKMTKIDLSYNRFEEIPNNFFLNVLSLNLSNNLIKTQGAYQISQVVSSKKVMWMELNLNDNEISTQGFISIIYALKENQQLISLSVADNEITGEGILVYIFNHEQLNLQYLDLSKNYLRYDLVYALISMMKECQLKTLVLSNLRQDENDIRSRREELFEIKCSNLRMLDLSENSCMISSLLNSLSLQYNRVEYLNLNACQISNKKDLIESLSSFLKRTLSLQTLLLARNNLGNLDEDSFKSLNNGLSYNQSLTHLDLSSNKLKLKILDLIEGLTKCRYLKFLNISNNLIYETKSLIQNFPLIFQNPNLQSIDISKNQIGSQTLLSIRQYNYNRPFPQMNLSKQQFTADDLHIITQIIAGCQSIKKLELSDNGSLDFMNNVITYGENVKVESLSINKILFREDSFSNLLLTIKQNIRHIKFLEISNTLLFQEQLIELLSQISEIKNLSVIILDYQSFRDKDEKVLEALYSCLHCFRNLKHFSVKKSTLSMPFYIFVSELLRKSNKLQELDLSGNVLNQNDFQILCDGLFANTSVTTLNFRNCKLTNESFLLLMPCLHAHSQIKNLDISQNDITMTILQKMEQLLGGNKCSLQKIKIQNIQTYWDVNRIPYSTKFSNLFQNLNNIDISQNNKQNENFMMLLDGFIKNRILQNIQILSLNNCEINHKQCQILVNLIEGNQIIQEISLIDNKLEYKGFKTIFDPILGNTSSLQKLNVSGNQIKNEYFNELTSAQIVYLKHFRLLIMDRNDIRGFRVSGLMTLLQKNPKLYIYNEWCEITEGLAKQIVEQYVIFINDFNMSKGIPTYLTSLKIEDTKLSDQFYIWFGSQFFRLQYLESINFKGSSQQMTSLSKMHMYIDIINENFVNYNLIEVCFEQNQDNEPNHFDDGLFKYWLQNLKDFLQNKNRISLQKMGEERNSNVVNEIEQVRWGKLGKWIVHIINTTLNLIQTQNYEFRFSSSLHSYTRKQLTRIRISLIASTINEIIKISLGIGAILMPGQLEVAILKCQNQTKCFGSDINLAFYGETIIIFFLVLSQSCYCLWFSIQIRLHATPDYCIQTPDKLRYQHFKFAHKDEIWLYLLQLIISFNYLLECKIMGSIFEMISLINSNSIDFGDVKYNLILLLSFIASIILFKTIFQLYVTIKALLIFLQAPIADQAKLFQAWFVKVQADHLLNLENVLKNYCPQSGIYIKGKLWNYNQLFEPILGILELCLLICIAVLTQFRRQFFLILQFQQLYTTVDILILIFLTKTFIKITKHFYCALLSRPPQLKVSDLNEALLIRRYQKMENSLQIVQKYPKIPIKKFKISSSQSIGKKSSADFKFGGLTKTKSDRSIIIQRENLNENDDSDYIPEPIQMPIAPIQYKSIKNIQFKNT